MVSSTAPLPGPTVRSGARIARYAGEIVYIYAFDVAYEMQRQPFRQLLGRPVEQFAVDASKRAPRGLFFHRPGVVKLPPTERLGPRGPMRLNRTIKLLSVGAISITVRVPFEAANLSDLVAYHDLRFTDGISLHDEVRQLAEEVRKEIQPQLVSPVRDLSDEEAYTVFCVNSPLLSVDGQKVAAEDWLAEHRRAVAALLTEESCPEQLSDQESEESTAKYFSYYDSDLVVVDWDAALVMDQPRYFDEVVHIMELANLQLAELEAYDRMLDAAVDRSYRDLAQRRWKGAHGNRVQRDLQELRVDLARLSDELLNITKFFGDWHLARIYQGLSQRFHLNDWHQTIDQKLKTLDDLYQIRRHDRTNRLMLILETLIVLLFIIDLVMLALA